MHILCTYRFVQGSKTSEYKNKFLFFVVKIVNPGQLWYGKYAFVEISDYLLTELEINKV